MRLFVSIVMIAALCAACATDGAIAGAGDATAEQGVSTPNDFGRDTTLTKIPRVRVEECPEPEVVVVTEECEEPEPVLLEPLCVGQPYVRVWGITPEDNQTGVTRKFVASIHAMDCDLRLNRIQIGIRGVVDYDGNGGETWAVYVGPYTTFITSYIADIGLDARDEANFIDLHDVPALAASLQTDDLGGFTIPANDEASFIVYAAMRDDAPAGKYLFSIEAVEGTFPETNETVSVNGMPMHGQPFTMTAE
ncbi:MAG: hypothetical protein Q7S02_02170 [bacterium]|nr:hypothetical protein [bacterium]